MVFLRNGGQWHFSDLLIGNFSKVTFVLEDFDLAEAEIFLVLPVVTDIDKLASVTLVFVAVEQCLLVLGNEKRIKIGAKIRTATFACPFLFPGSDSNSLVSTFI